MSKKGKVHIVGHHSLIHQMYQSRGYAVVDTLDKADIVQFIGGADINPRYYGETPMYRTNTSEMADSRDEHAFNHSRDKFHVGICRGGQFLNCMSGGRMWQHVNGHAIGGTHPVKDLMFTDSPVTIDVSSTHHQMMIPGQDGEVLAFAYGLASGHQTQNDDNDPEDKFETEVVWYNKTRSLCFQPHPEFQQYKSCTNYFFKLLEHFFKP